MGNFKRCNHEDFWSELKVLSEQYHELAALKARVEHTIISRALAEQTGVPSRKAAVLRHLREGQPIPCGMMLFRVFWWGFQVEVPSPELRGLHERRGGVADCHPLPAAVSALGVNALAALGFLSAHRPLLEALDRGRGVYIAMTWNAPGLFVPTTVR